MICLELHEQWVGPVFDQVRDRRMTQAVHRQLTRQSAGTSDGQDWQRSVYLKTGDDRVG
jgi:hypothetical protein